MKKIIPLLLLLILTVGILCSCDCKHKKYTEATCTTPSKCLKCEEILAEATGHSETVYAAAVLPTCTTTGLTKGKRCSVCNEILATQTVVPALGHTEVVDEPVSATCTATGLTEGKHCSVCNKILATQTVVPALGHTEVVDEPVSATCTTTGLTEGKHCSVCNEILVAQTVVDALGHTEGDWVVDLAPTCAEPGSKHQICSVCDASINTEVIEATELHDYVGNITVPATCGTSGTKIFTCTVCAHSYTETIKPTQNHSYSTTSRTEATCSENGSIVYTCSVCSYSVTTLIPATGNHSYTATTTKQATCAESGIWTYTCSTCNYSFNKSFTQSTRVHGTVTNGYCDTCNKYLGSSDTYSNYYYKKLKYYIIDNGTFDSTTKRYTWKINTETSSQGSRYVYYAYYDSASNTVMLSIVWDNTHVMAIALDTKLSKSYAWTYTNTDGFRLAGTLSAKTYTSSSVLYPSETNASNASLNLTLRQMSATMLNLILINFEIEVRPDISVSCYDLGFTNF